MTSNDAIDLVCGNKLLRNVLQFSLDGFEIVSWKVSDSRLRFDTNRLSLCRCFQNDFMCQQVYITVDQAAMSTGVENNYHELTFDGVIYIGGGPPAENLCDSSARCNFVGCIKDVNLVFFS